MAIVPLLSYAAATFESTPNSLSFLFFIGRPGIGSSVILAHLSKFRTEHNRTDRINTDETRSESKCTVARDFGSVFNISFNRLLRRFETEVAASVTAGAHGPETCGAMVLEQLRIEDLRRLDTNIHGPPPIELLVLGRRTVLVRNVAAPSAFNPAGDNGRLRP